MRHESNEDHARTKTYEEVIQPYLDSNEYENEVQRINVKYFALRNKLPKEEREEFDLLMAELNQVENRNSRYAYQLGIEQGKSMTVSTPDHEIEC